MKADDNETQLLLGTLLWQVVRSYIVIVLNGSLVHGKHSVSLTLHYFWFQSVGTSSPCYAPFQFIRTSNLEVEAECS